MRCMEKFQGTGVDGEMGETRRYSNRNEEGHLVTGENPGGEKNPWTHPGSVWSTSLLIKESRKMRQKYPRKKSFYKKGGKRYLKGGRDRMRWGRSRAWAVHP